jgi:hypothetical protein
MGRGSSHERIGRLLNECPKLTPADIATVLIDIDVSSGEYESDEAIDLNADRYMQEASRVIHARDLTEQQTKERGAR